MPKQGYFTPSKYKDAMTNAKDKKSIGETALSYAQEVAMQRLGVDIPEIHAPALDWGNEWEPVAIQRYQQETFNDVEPVFEPLIHPVFDFVAGTPDGLITSPDTTGIIEVKCPYNPKNHLANILSGAQIKDYIYQIQGYMWITGAQYCDFVSFDPRFPEHLQIVIHKVERDNELIKNIQERIIQLNKLSIEIVNSINSQK